MKQAVGCTLDAQITDGRRAELVGQLASVGQMRPGSLTLVRRWVHCAKPGDPGHGPELSLTRKRNGKTVTRLIRPDAEAQTRAQIAECRRFRQLSQALLEVSSALCEARLAAGCEQTAEPAETVKKGASKQRSRSRSTRKSTRW